jgi:hypothetical protein
MVNMLAQSVEETNNSGSLIFRRLDVCSKCGKELLLLLLLVGCKPTDAGNNLIVI